jgi:phospholipase/lecithinase/hemolysin
MIPNLPGYAVVDDPSPNPIPSLVGDFSTAVNAALAAEIQSLRGTLQDATIIEVDFFGLFEDMVDNPGAFGLSNVTAPCLDLDAGFASEGVCSNPEEYLMFDYIHPSAAAHAVMGDAALASLQPVPLPAAAYLFITALVGLFGTKRLARKRQLSV